jgi:hypothetical protein
VASAANGCPRPPVTGSDTDGAGTAGGLCAAADATTDNITSQITRHIIDIEAVGASMAKPSVCIKLEERDQSSSPRQFGYEGR